MPFGDPSPTAWILLWVAALSSLLTLGLTLRRDRQAARAARLEEERAWSLHWADYLDDPPFRCLRLRLHDVRTHKCRLRSVSVVKPGPARIAPHGYAQAPESAAREARADRTAIGRRITLDKDLDGSSSRSAGVQGDDAYFYVLVPPKPALTFAPQTRIQVVCRVSEFASRARRRKFTLISPPVDWAPADAPKAEDLAQPRDAAQSREPARTRDAVGA